MLKNTLAVNIHSQKIPQIPMKQVLYLILYQPHMHGPVVWGTRASRTETVLICSSCRSVGQESKLGPCFCSWYIQKTNLTQVSCIQELPLEKNLLIIHRFRYIGIFGRLYLNLQVRQRIFTYFLKVFWQRKQQQQKQQLPFDLLRFIWNTC